MKTLAVKILLGVLLLGAIIAASSPQDCASAIAELEQRVEAQRKLLADWAGLIHYGSENTELPKPKPEENRVVVSGVNIKVRHTKPSQADPQGGIKRKEAPIHVSNVAHVDPTSGKPTRVGFKVEGTGEKSRKVRFAKRSGETIDGRYQIHAPSAVAVRPEHS